MKSLTRDLRAEKRKRKRLQLKLQKKEQTISIDDDNFKDVMKVVLNYINKHHAEAKGFLVEALVSLKTT